MSVFKLSLGHFIVLSLLGLTCFVKCAESSYKAPCNRTNSTSRRARQTDSPAPIDCKLKGWSSWTPCDACTEKTLRFRYVERHSQFGGAECVDSQWDNKLCPIKSECEPQDDCGEMYACPESGRCIAQHLRCNGESDCGFGTDEDECEEVKQRETKCVNMLPIPGARKATQGYNALADTFVNPVLDAKYFGGFCEYIYNGEWRQLTYDALCENLYYNDVEKYFRKPHNFLSYRLMAHSISEGSQEHYSDAASLLEARKKENSENFGFTFGIAFVEMGVTSESERGFLTNMTQYDSKKVEFLRLMSRVETAEFKLRSGGLMLDEDLLQALMELPEYYDFGSYSHFLNEYGTHYITHGILGGVLEYVVVLNKEEMEKMMVQGEDVGSCLGGSIGLSIPFSENLSAKLKAEHKKCHKTGSLHRDTHNKNDLVHDVIGFVKGGITGPSAAQLAVHDATSYRNWGKSLKYNPAVIEYEALPIYELVRFSTVAEQARTRLPLLKRAWEEYIAQFNPCRCASCMNNGVPVLSRMACSCLCKEGYSGLACENTERKDPTHGAWSCWSLWSPCVSGTKTRRRECNNPAPKDNGFPCQGNPGQTKVC